jgi:putative membrane protein
MTNIAFARSEEAVVMMSWNDSGWGWFWMAFGMLIFWGLVAWVVVALVRSSSTPPTPPPAERGSRAEAILAERFARGEIDATEYHERLRELRTPAGT